ncbi:alpha/beta hydrolase [Falsiroseomonas tokyonensis]|uniref:Alpha/beta hydrolase n=1 Tax=Falsiroseomonas tokyonensis TaxID=430521 RepID=A0ABV7C156_9PROT|nr:alpha/beta fold hydrolase [Falsiroseomonas tokyonensis]MBU8541205.1 alpha/beta hydrolase [Falsiroseomonas tokyonensis]
MRAPDPSEMHFARGRMLAWDPPAPRPDAPALLLLHGAACGSWVWAEGFGARLAAAGHAVFAPGFNRGTPDRPAGLADYMADARAAMAALHRRVVLVGHSLGGLVAQRLLDAPEVAGLALLAPAPPEGLAWASWRLALADPPLWRAVARMTEPGGTVAEAALLRRALFGPGMAEAVALHHLARMGAESRLALLEAQAPQPVPPAWGLGRPLVVFGGRRDPLVPPDAVVRTAAWHAAPFALLDGMGHAMMLDLGWEALADRLAGWLEETYR